MGDGDVDDSCEEKSNEIAEEYILEYIIDNILCSFVSDINLREICVSYFVLLIIY